MPAPSFAYIAADVPEGMTLREHRRVIDARAACRRRGTLRAMRASVPISLALAARAVAYYRTNPYG